MSTETENDRATELGDVVTKLVVFMARLVAKFVLKCVYHVFMIFVAVLGVCLIVALVGGVTALSGVVFGKLVAVAVFLTAMLVLVASPVRETYNRAKEASLAVFTQYHPASV